MIDEVSINAKRIPIPVVGFGVEAGKQPGLERLCVAMAQFEGSQPAPVKVIG